MDVGYAIGNANSRKDFDLRKLFGRGITYGCNSIHRDFVVENIVCNKLHHLQEAVEHNLQKKSYLFTTTDLINIVKNPHLQVLPEVPYTITHEKDEAKNWTSGSYAILLAALENEIVTIIGYDFIGSGERSMKNPFGTINCIYSGSQNNPKETAKQRDMGYDVQQIGHIIEHFNDVKFIFVNDWTPDSLLNHPNAYADTYENLENQLLTT
jgi:hypothetical protein|tara:strand:- start:60 stop:689 length:630 start_codon:yes stop_codon:yes gene_type:complete